MNDFNNQMTVIELEVFFRKRSFLLAEKAKGCSQEVCPFMARSLPVVGENAEGSSAESLGFLGRKSRFLAMNPHASGRERAAKSVSLSWNAHFF
ncbi:MAG: hypothetical protein IJ196_01140 [Prevotella sp.]|nr:hypothetical protein [Prevotella sp.]